MRLSANTATVAALACLTLIGAGCAPTVTKKEPTFDAAAQNAFIPANQQAATTLLAQVKASLIPNQPLIVATIVDINVLEKSSTMGRLVSEQISGAFSRAGYQMIEMKFRENVYMKRSEGELLLTREINEVAKLHNAQAVIVGTYAVASDVAFINLKVVQPNSNLVLAAHDYALPLDANVRAMLGSAR